MVIPKDKVTLAESFKAVRIENTMEAPVGAQSVLKVAPHTSKTVVHTSTKIRSLMNKTNLKRVDKENGNGSRAATYTQSNSQSMLGKSD